MKDSYGRTIDYLRISITDRCNLRCRYCMPCGIETVSHGDILTFEEIRRVALCGARLGIRHIKVTGGEPLVRKGCCELIRILKAVPGIEHVTLTTNGILLEEYLEELIQSGIDGINVSLDTVDRRLYERITGKDGLSSVLSVLERASSLSVPLKINAVSLDWKELDRGTGKGENGRRDTEYWKELVLLAKDYPIDVRFIEMMPIGYGRGYQTMNYEKLPEKMMKEFPGMKREDGAGNVGKIAVETVPGSDRKKPGRVHGFGPAVYYEIPGFLGSIGFISAVHGKFCADCNRVRLTAQGYLKTCLCFEDGADLRVVLRNKAENGSDRVEDKMKELTAVMKEAISRKPAAHCFDTPEKITEQHNMVSIGG